MVYGLLIIGIIISVYGWKMIRDKEGGHFDENIKADTASSRLDIIEDKLDILLQGGTYNPTDRNLSEDKGQPSSQPIINESIAGHQEDNGINYIQVANKIKEMSEENKSVEEMALALNIGKGEVLLLKRLLVR